MKIIRAVLLAVVVLISVGCTQTKPPSAGKPLTLKVKKPPLRPISEESDNDYYADHHDSSVLRSNLPLAGTNWEWEGELSPYGYKGLDDSSAYRLEFKTDGWFDFRADCRRGAGMYEVNGDHIVLAVIKSSHEGCHRNSRADDFQSDLEAARTYKLDDSKLFFDGKHQDKTMVFHLTP